MAADLNPRQLRFCEEYAVDLNGQQAAIRAGYSENGADVTAVRLLADPRVKARVGELAAARSERVGLQAEDVLAHLAALSTANITDVLTFGTREVTVGFDDDGNALPPAQLHDAVRVERQGVNYVEAKVACSDDLPEHVKAAISSVKLTKDGALEVRMHDKNSALEKAARYLGLLKPADVSVNVTLEQIVLASFGGARG